MSSEGLWQEHWLNELGYTLRLRLFSDHVAEFEVFTIVCWNNVTGTMENPMVERKGAPFPAEAPTATLDEGLPFAHGSVKWDGCMEFYIEHAPDEGIHMCSRRDGENLGKMLVTIWDLASKLVPAWDHQCAGTKKEEA